LPRILADASRHHEPVRLEAVSDIHAPYHTADAIVAACKLARLRKVVGILLNGDIADCFAVSRWETDPRKRNFKHEVETVRSLLLFIRSRFPDARIVYKWGNHEERYDAYQQVKAPHTLGIDDYEFESVMRVRANGIETVKNMQPIKLGKLFVLHGHEYRFAIQNPVNPARGLFLRSQVSAMCGHFHQTSQHSEKNLAEHVTSTWSTGCMCDLHPEYMPLNKWNVGCAFVHVFRDGAFDVNNSRIVDGKVWA
jgi:predicted phosphodiesterase